MGTTGTENKSIRRLLLDNLVWEKYYQLCYQDIVVWDCYVYIGFWVYYIYIALQIQKFLFIVSAKGMGITLCAQRGNTHTPVSQCIPLIKWAALVHAVTVWIVNTWGTSHCRSFLRFRVSCFFMYFYLNVLLQRFVLVQLCSWWIEICVTGTKWHKWLTKKFTVSLRCRCCMHDEKVQSIKFH